MYADDTVIYYAAPLIPNLIDFCFEHRVNLYIHSKKTEYVIFGTSQRLNQSTWILVKYFLVIRRALKRKKHYKYLGLVSARFLVSYRVT